MISKTKELINQVYRTARLLDINDQFRFNRVTSSLQMNSPIVEYITPDKAAADKKEQEKADKKLFNISLANVANNASWDLSDVLMSTPVTLAHIL